MLSCHVFPQEKLFIFLFPFKLSETASDVRRLMRQSTISVMNFQFNITKKLPIPDTQIETYELYQPTNVTIFIKQPSIFNNKLTRNSTSPDIFR